MKFTNANSFKAKIKNIAKEKGIPAQQVQQNYLIEQALRLISKSDYRTSFIIKGGYLIGNMIGIDKRTTMDLDMTLKGTDLSETTLIDIFGEILGDSDDGFKFVVNIIKKETFGAKRIDRVKIFDARDWLIKLEFKI